MALLTDKVTIVNGASRGIGAAAARLFAAEGAKLVLAARSEGPLTALADELAATAVVADAASPDDAERVVQAALDTHGRLDAAFNNFGIGIPPKRLADVTPEEWDALYGINVRGSWLAARAQIPAMLASGGGALVFTSSVGGLLAGGGLGAYQTGKHALVGLVKALTYDYAASGIRACAIAPGSTRTEMIEDWASHTPGLIERLTQGNPMRRMADPSESAEAAAWLLSDRASYVTGVTLPVDGGLVAAPA
jgi:NAD(P)-dependent dehydrogenase (short-subunit alcohol dehydrogenase family)